MSFNIKDFLTLDEVEGEKTYLIDHSACERCSPFDGSEIVIDDIDPDIVTQFFCVGFIPYIENPKDEHEKNNRIRCCVVGHNKITVHEWTPWEAHRVGVSLCNISAQFLLKDQPGEAWSELDQLLNRKEDTEKC